MGYFKPRFKEGDLALYHDSYPDKYWAMKVKQSKVKACKGDLIPHQYYSGDVILLTHEEDGRFSPKNTKKFFFNVRESELSDLCEEDIIKIVPLLNSSPACDC